MLLRFTVENFGSIRQRQELSLVASKLEENSHDALWIEGFKHQVLPVVAIYGPNASGKSTVLKALRFMERTVLRSHSKSGPDDDIEINPFLLNKHSSREPSNFEVELLLDGARYCYGFSATRKRIVREWLYAYPQGKRQLWLDRNAARKPEFKFGRGMRGPNLSIRDLTRPNSLFLSAASQNNHQGVASIFRWFSRSLFVLIDDAPMSRAIGAATMLVKNKALAEPIRLLLKKADLGIVDFSIQQEEMDNTVKQVLRLLSSEDPSLEKRLKDDPYIPNIKFSHAGADGSIELPISDESRGTQGLFGLAPRIVSALALGEVLCIDELDASIHPLIALEIVRLFADRSTNPKNAQLVFNTHDTNLLACGVLRRDEIWFTEKSKHGESRLFPLSDYHPRKAENIVRGYLQGRFGAVPFVGGGEEFIKALKRNSKAKK